jgi:hypothetical protein
MGQCRERVRSRSLGAWHITGQSRGQMIHIVSN